MARQMPDSGMPTKTREPHARVRAARSRRGARACTTQGAAHKAAQKAVPMFGLRKIIAREGRQRREGASDTQVDSAPRGHNLEAEYETLIITQCVRWGIDETCITLEVRRLGRTNSGLDIYGGMMRLTRWQRDSALRVLLGLPLLE